MMLQLNQDTVFINLQAQDCLSAINKLAKSLFEQGFVTAEYGAMTCRREEIHPTGLPTSPICIAFPHADCEGVLQSALAVGILEQPVKFRNMADPDEQLDVHIVIMMANSNPTEQIDTLRNLAELFGEGEKLVELQHQPDSEAAVNWLKRELRLDI